MSVDPYYPSPGNALNGTTTAATPPTYNSGNGWFAVPKSWAAGAVEELDVHVYADGTNAVTVARLVGARAEYQTLADDDVDTVDTTDNELDIASHAYVTGDGPVRLTNSGGALPGGLATNTDYWIIVIGAGAISLADSLYNALTNKEIDITSAGSGTHTIVDVVTGKDHQKTKRLHWGSMGFLGESNDGAMSLTSAMSWQGRVKHADEIVAYSMVGTFGAAVATYCRLVPRPIRP